MAIAVRVEQVDLDHSSDTVERLDALLPSEERTGRPASRIVRAATRDILSRILGVEPRTVKISRACARCGHPSHGKPALGDDANLSFSASHSGGVGLVAVAFDGAIVGVDVEQVRPRTELARMAARALTPPALAAWRAAPEPERLARFLQAWTAKEAFLKAIGQGVVTRLAAVPEEPAGWWLRSLAVPDSYVASVAVDRDVGVEQADWTPPAFSASGGTAG